MIRRGLALAALALIAAACSVTRLAYENAAPLGLWYIGDYVDLTEEQRQFAHDRLQRAMAWHRAEELPAYRSFFENVVARSGGEVREEEVAAAYGEIRSRYRRALGRLIPDAAELFLQFDASQAMQLQRKFEEDNRKIVKESVGGSPEERARRRLKHRIGQFESWVGRLGPEQRALVDKRLGEGDDLLDERLADRRYRQGETLALMRAKPTREQMIAGLRRILLDTDAWRRPEYAKKLAERDRRYFATVAELSSTLTPEQRAHLRDRVGDYLREIEAVLGER